MNKYIKWSLASVLAPLVLVACGGDDDDDVSHNPHDPSGPGTIVDVAVESGNFTTLVTALQTAELDDDLADESKTYTVFAPTDAAFDLLGQQGISDLLVNPELADILLYHVVGGAAIDSTAAKVSTVDIQASNGVIHVLDAVLMPPADMGTPTNNIVETAVAAGSFTTLVDLVQAAGLDTLLGDESKTFTVFAPTDAAFAKIDSATLAALGADIPALTGVLAQHVIEGAAVDSPTAFSLNGQTSDTAAGEDISIDIVDGMLEVQGAKVITFDIYTTNGIIHVIDTVITETLN